MRIENMVNGKGNVIANQFIIINEDEVVFQSYKSKIAKYNSSTRELKIYKDWNYSQTTLKYFKIFVNNYTPYGYDSKKQFEMLMKEHENIKLLEV